MGETYIIALWSFLPNTAYCSYVVALLLQGRTADTSSQNNSYRFKSSWLTYINPLFIHTCGQVNRCFWHPGCNCKWWDRLNSVWRCTRGKRGAASILHCSPAQNTCTTRCGHKEEGDDTWTQSPRRMRSHKGQSLTPSGSFLSVIRAHTKKMVFRLQFQPWN